MYKMSKGIDIDADDLLEKNTSKSIRSSMREEMNNLVWVALISSGGNTSKGKAIE